MNKKIIIAVVIIIFLIIAGAGCLKSDKKKTDKTSFEEVKGDYPSEIGWLESGDAQAREDDKIYVEVDSTISIKLNDSNITSVSVTLNFEDYDATHSGSDGNSPSDDVTVTAVGFNQTFSGTTPFSATFSLKSNESDGQVGFLPQDLSFHVYARCFSEITYPPSGRPALINLYTRDQGVAYDILASYQYLREVKV